MNISFQKKSGDSSLGIAFFWKLTIETKSPVIITDHFIPELFLDYLCIQKGRIKLIDPRGNKTALPQQTLKTIHTQPLTFSFSAPLVVFGARLLLKFAESFWEENIQPNFLLKNNGQTKT